MILIKIVPIPIFFVSLLVAGCEFRTVALQIYLVAFFWENNQRYLAAFIINSQNSAFLGKTVNAENCCSGGCSGIYETVIDEQGHGLVQGTFLQYYFVTLPVFCDFFLLVECLECPHQKYENGQKKHNHQYEGAK